MLHAIFNAFKSFMLEVMLCVQQMTLLLVCKIIKYCGYGAPIKVDPDAMMFEVADNAAYAWIAVVIDAMDCIILFDKRATDYIFAYTDVLNSVKKPFVGIITNDAIAYKIITTHIQKATPKKIIEYFNGLLACYS